MRRNADRKINFMTTTSIPHPASRFEPTSGSDAVPIRLPVTCTMWEEVDRGSRNARSFLSASKAFLSSLVDSRPFESVSLGITFTDPVFRWFRIAALEPAWRRTITRRPVSSICQTTGDACGITELEHPEETQAALAHERELFARQRAAEVTKADEALRGYVDALASVSELDDFLGQVMAAITRQLNAFSSALFLRVDESDFLMLDLVFQDGRVLTPAEASFPEELRSVRLDKRELDPAQKAAVLVNLVSGPTRISDSHRSYLLGLGVKTLLIIPLFVGRRLVGSLNFRFTNDREFRPEEVEIARLLAVQTSLAVQLIRLAKTAKQSAVLEERTRLAGEIHDSLAQSFVAIATQLNLAGEMMKAREGECLRYLDRAKDLARFGLAEARRTALSLHSFILDKIGLTEAIAMLVERSTVPGRLQCGFSAKDSRANDLPLETQQHLLRIAQEAIGNAIRHANPSIILVSLRSFDSSSGRECDGCYLELQVKDNGRGISSPEVMSRGFGLISMQNRAKKIGASFDIRTKAGRGAAVVVRLPINT